MTISAECAAWVPATHAVVVKVPCTARKVRGKVVPSKRLYQFFVFVISLQLGADSCNFRFPANAPPLRHVKKLVSVKTGRRDIELFVVVQSQTEK